MADPIVLSVINGAPDAHPYKAQAKVGETIDFSKTKGRFKVVFHTATPSPLDKEISHKNPTAKVIGKPNPKGYRYAFAIVPPGSDEVFLLADCPSIIVNAK